MNTRTFLVASIALVLSLEAQDQQIAHSFLATGASTYLVDESGKVEWSYPKSTRDGWVLPNGNLLLTVSKDQDYPGGAVVELTREGKTLFEYKGTQSEVNTAEALENGNIMLTEAGVKPRLLEIKRDGTVVADVPLRRR